MAIKNIQFLQGSPSTNISLLDPKNGAFYLTDYVKDDLNSNRLYIGREEKIFPVVTPNPFSLKLQCNKENFIYDGSDEKTIEINPSTIGIDDYELITIADIDEICNSTYI